VTLVTSGDADGIYSGPGSFLSISVDTNWFSVTTPGVNLLAGRPVDFSSATVANGKVTSLYFWVMDDVENAQFGGLDASYVVSGAHHGGYLSVNAVLNNVPEPETLSLMVAGLLLTGLVRRSRKSARGTPHRQSESAAKLT
jgi:hypothetical protein